MSNELTKITVTLANRKYTLSVEREDEILIRNASEKINGRVKEYLQQYPGKDIQDILAMILLNYAASLGKAENANQYIEDELLSGLIHINQLLAKAV